MTTFTHSLAVLIGINAYSSGIPQLTTAVNDATRLGELVRQPRQGYPTSACSPKRNSASSNAGAAA